MAAPTSTRACVCHLNTDDDDDLCACNNSLCGQGDTRPCPPTQAAPAPERDGYLELNSRFLLADVCVCGLWFVRSCRLMSATVAAVVDWCASLDLFELCSSNVQQQQQQQLQLFTVTFQTFCSLFYCHVFKSARASVHRRRHVGAVLLRCC